MRCDSALLRYTPVRDVLMCDALMLDVLIHDALRHASIMSDELNLMRNARCAKVRALNS